MEKNNSRTLFQFYSYTHRAQLHTDKWSYASKIEKITASVYGAEQTRRKIYVLSDDKYVAVNSYDRKYHILSCPKY